MCVCVQSEIDNDFFFFTHVSPQALQNKPSLRSGGQLSIKVLKQKEKKINTQFFFSKTERKISN